MLVISQFATIFLCRLCFLKAFPFHGNKAHIFDTIKMSYCKYVLANVNLAFPHNSRWKQCSDRLMISVRRCLKQTSRRHKSWPCCRTRNVRQINGATASSNHQFKSALIKNPVNLQINKTLNSAQCIFIIHFEQVITISLS